MDETYGIYGTDFYQKAIDLFYKYVKIDCDFKDNICKANRESTNKIKTNTPNYCCCADCAQTNGYLYNMFLSNTTTKGIAIEVKIWGNNFNPKTGYWRKNIGCILPRKYRSMICNFYVCHYLSDKNYLDVKSQNRIIKLSRRICIVLNNYYKDKTS